MSETSGASRSIPGWAAELIAVLSRDRSAVVTREDLVGHLDAIGITRDPERTAFDLQQLGWFASLHLKGVWAFVPAGEADVNDPYIDLRAWKAREPDASFALAGEAAAWHLGYLPRRFGGTIAVWLPSKARVPHGLRSCVSLVRLGWAGEQAHELAPTSRLLRRKGLDLTNWAPGLRPRGAGRPARGPAGVVSRMGRPHSSTRRLGLGLRRRQDRTPARRSVSLCMATRRLPTAPRRPNRRRSRPTQPAARHVDARRVLRRRRDGRVVITIQRQRSPHRAAARSTREGVMATGTLTEALVRLHGAGRADTYGAALLDIAQDHLLYLLAELGYFDDETLLFKGGTALRKCRLGGGGRFSTDLDFVAPDDDTVLDVCGAIDGASIAGFQFSLQSTRGDGRHWTLQVRRAQRAFTFRSARGSGCHRVGLPGTRPLRRIPSRSGVLVDN